MKVNENLLREFRKTITPDENDLIDRIYKKNGEFRKTKPKVNKQTDPKSGESAYLHRMLSFYTGHNLCIPVTADWDLPQAYGPERSEKIKQLDTLAKKISECQLPDFEIKENHELVCNIERESLYKIAAIGNTKKVNQLNVSELLAVALSVKSCPFPVGQYQEIYRKALAIVKEDQLAVGKDGLLGQLRLEIVKLAGSGFNAPYDSYLSAAVELLNKES